MKSLWITLFFLVSALSLRAQHADQQIASGDTIAKARAHLQRNFFVCKDSAKIRALIQIEEKLSKELSGLDTAGKLSDAQREIKTRILMYYRDLAAAKVLSREELLLYSQGNRRLAPKRPVVKLTEPKPGEVKKP